MSLQTRLSDFITSVGTDYKQLRTWIAGSNTADLTGLTTTDKTSLLAAVNEVHTKATAAAPAASETTAGVLQVATQAETDAGTIDTDAVSPLKLKNRLAAYQPKDADLDAIAALATTAFGRDFLVKADAPSTRTKLGLAAVATSGSASDITTGTLPTSVLPPLAINEVFAPLDEAAMLALAAQRGDIAIRQDNGKTYVLAADAPATLANWKQITAAGDVTSVAGRTGAVVLAKGDVGLGSVDNTSDVAKPVSTAQQTALDAKMAKSANLSDVADKAIGRTNLDVYSRVELGNPETDLVAIYNTAKA